MAVQCHAGMCFCFVGPSLRLYPYCCCAFVSLHPPTSTRLFSVFSGLLTSPSAYPSDWHYGIAALLRQLVKEMPADKRLSFQTRVANARTKEAVGSLLQDYAPRLECLVLPHARSRDIDLQQVKKVGWRRIEHNYERGGGARELRGGGGYDCSCVSLGFFRAPGVCVYVWLMKRFLHQPEMLT